MGIILEYIDYLLNPDNEEAVERILEAIFSQDVLTDEVIENNFKAVERIKGLGELQIYEKALQDLKDSYDMK